MVLWLDTPRRIGCLCAVLPGGHFPVPGPVLPCWAGCSTCSSAGSTSPWPLPLAMVLFLGIYFYLYSQAGNILNAMAAEGASMAGALQAGPGPSTPWAGPAPEASRPGSLPGICAAVSGLAYWFLSATFLGSAAMQHTGRRKKRGLRQPPSRFHRTSPDVQGTQAVFGARFTSPTWVWGLVMILAPGNRRRRLPEEGAGVL